MGTASAVFYTKQAAILTAQHIVNNGNIFFNAIESAGMVKVANEVISGQCDRLVLEPTANPYDVVVSLSGPGWSASQNIAVKGVKVFRHPTLNFYLKVEICEIGASTSTYGPNYTAMTVRYTLAMEIDTSGNLINPQLFQPRGGPNYGWQYGFNAVDSSGYGYGFGLALQLKVSAGKDHFCLGHTKDFQTYETGYVATSSSPVGTGPCKLGYSSCSIAILKSTKSQDLYVLIPRGLEGSSSYPNEIQASSYNQLQMGLPRQYRINAITGNQTNLGVSFFSALQTGTVSDQKGIRVAQMMTTEDDELISLPLATMHSGAIADNAITTVDVDGNGPRQYFAAFGLGGSVWHTAMYPIEKHPIYLFPWGD